MSGFSMSVEKSKNSDISEFRDNGDNKLFTHLQIKDISTVTDEKTIFVWDIDGVPFKTASNAEDDYITVTETKTGDTWELDNVTKFKGGVRKPGAFSTSSWLGLENVKRSAQGLEEWKLDDFTIEKGKRIKKGKNIDTVISNMEEYIEAVKNQWGVKNFLFCLGEGECFRHNLPLPQPYKGGRDPSRPLLLKEARKYLLAKDNSELAPEGFECDDLVEWYGAQGYKDYVKTGKFSYVVLSEDKDCGGNPKLWCLYTKEGPKFPNPQAVLIEGSNKSVGYLQLLQMSSPEVKGTGLVWLVAQAFGMGDGADYYHPYLKFDKPIKEHIKYGKTQFYKEFSVLKTQQEVLQKAVDNMFLWFPKGIKYTDHKGNELDVDTYIWMDTCFKVAYMTRSKNDLTSLKQLLDYFKVDYQKIVNNNVEKVLPLKGDKELRDIVADLKISLEDVAKKDYKSSMKKGDLVECLDIKVGLLNNIIDNLREFYKEEDC